MSDGVSVVICCHNSAKRLPVTLQYLAAQQVPGGMEWEVIVVDNASTDATSEAAVRFWPEPAPAPLRVVSEPEVGLSHARVRGIQEARYEIISFIDDDNWIDTYWVGRVQWIFAEHPDVGVCGGRTEAEYETAPPDWIKDLGLEGFYAVGQQYESSGDITDTEGTLLWGAGLSLRTAAVRRLLEENFVFMQTGRRGNVLQAGEDTELCFALRSSGWRFWYDDGMVLWHFIPRERLRWDYARRMMRGMGKASVLIELYCMAQKRAPYARYASWKKTWLFQFFKVLRQMAGLFVFHFQDSVLGTEGSSHVLEYEKKAGRLTALWALCGRYRKMMRQIRHAAWVHDRS